MEKELIEQLNKAEKYLRKIRTAEADALADLVGDLINGKAKATDKLRLQKVAQFISDRTNAHYGLRDAYERDMAHVRALLEAIEQLK